MSDRYRALVSELLFPRTDAGVIVQLAVAVAASGGLLWWSRTRRSEIKVFAVGLVLVVLAGFGLRALH